MPRHFAYSPDIATASTLPSRLYTDPVYLELEQERIFGSAWLRPTRSDGRRPAAPYVDNNDAARQLEPRPAARRSG